MRLQPRPRSRKRTCQHNWELAYVGHDARSFRGVAAQNRFHPLGDALRAKRAKADIEVQCRLRLDRQCSDAAILEQPMPGDARISSQSFRRCGYEPVWELAVQSSPPFGKSCFPVVDFL